MFNSELIVQEYQADASLTVPLLAIKLGMKAADVGAVLRLSGIKLRRGGFNDECRAKGIETRQKGALRRVLRELADKHGVDVVRAELDAWEQEIEQVAA